MADRRIADRYEPVEELGRGGQATVVKAIDTRHGRLVALKVRAAPNGATEALLLEARALLSLPSHPGLAHARDDLFDAGRHVLVLDWVDGVDLAQLLARRGSPGLPLSSVLRWAAQAAEALSVLHRHGVVHGDVKPANLILDREGRVVLVDLGSSSVPDGTGPGAGTPGFRAPEVSAGSVPTPASDVYSLAASVFALLTGGPPTGAVPVWAGIDPHGAKRLEAGVRAGLAIDPARRPPTPGALVERLRAGWQDSTPTGVVTVLLAEVMNASALWEHEPNEAPELFASLQLTVDRCVESHRGHRIGGDGADEGRSMGSVFANAVDAVTAAVDLQREVTSTHARLHVRVGMATGEPVLDGGEIRGPVVNRAAGVRELARPGEVLVSETTADIVRLGLPSGVDLLRLGSHRLVASDSTDDVSAVVADGVAAPPDPTRSPYPGLAAFTADHADLFVGREAVIERCHALFTERGFVAIVGASGSGKTSLARAGLAPRLGDVTIVRPGDDPVGAFERANLDEHPHHVLVVDQLEELVTLCDDEAARARFVETALAHPGGMVVTVRADLYGDLAGLPELAERLADSQVLLGPMDDADVVRAVEEPARRCGFDVEPGLAEVVVRELGHAPGALPLLGHALRETWLRRDGRTITLEAYRASGGVESAIASTADRALATLDDDRRVVARQVLLRMVEIRRDGDDARRWASRRELFEVQPSHAPAVVAVLADARLLVLDGDQVTVAHEALLRAWPTLRRWIADERADLLARQDVRVDAERWVADGRSDADLYRGARLDAALAVAARGGLPQREAAFVDAGRLLRDRERAEARRRTRRLRVLAGVATVLALVAATVGVVALVQREDAQQARAAAEGSAAQADEQRAAADEQAERANAEAERAEAEAERASEEARRADEEADRARAQALAASAVSALDEDPSLAKLLAVASATVADPTPETTAVLHRAWAADRVTARPGPTYDLSVQSADIDPSGRRMVVAGSSVGEGSSKAIDVVDLVTDTTAWTFALDDASAWVVSPRFSPDGEHVVAGVFWDPHNRDRVPPVARGGAIDDPPPGLVGVRIWDADTGEPVEQHDVGRCGGYPVAISATHVVVRTLHGSDAVLAACDWRYGTIGAELVDRRTGDRRLLTDDAGYHQRGATMSRDGTTVAYDDVDAVMDPVARTRLPLRHDVVVADTSTGQPLLLLTPDPTQRHMVRALSHDGSLLLFGDRPIQVWDVATGEQVATFDEHQGGSLYATFVPATRTVLSTGADGTMREWDADTGEEIRVYPGIAEGPVAATPDGRVLTIGHSGSNESPPTLIETRAHGELGAVETCTGQVAADSLRVVSALAVFHTICEGDRSATTYVVDMEERRVLHALPGHQAQALAVSPDGTRLVRQEGGGTTYGPLAVRDLRTGAQIVELDGLCTWDAGSPLPPGEQDGCATSPEQPFAVRALRLKWSPDGTMIAAASGTTVVVWDADTGALLHADDPDPDRIGVADVIFSPDSALLLTTSNDSRHRTISTSTWEVVADGDNGGSAIGLVGFSPDGSKVLAAGQLMAHTGGALYLFDLAAQQLALSRNDIHEGSLRSVAISPGGALIATAASDGLVRVWDGATLELVHEVPLGETQIEGVAFVDDHHLAVTPAEGNLLLVTIDPDELLDIVGRSLTRGFTATECARFGFGDECPTLAELRGVPDGADDPAVLEGRYEVRWTGDQFSAALAALGEPKIVGRSTADGYPGTYTVTFDDGRFDIVHERLGAFCTGSYQVSSDRVRLVAERREPQVGCLPGRFLDATFVITDDGLAFRATAAHPVDAVLFAGRPLTRVDG
jgi:WD40 repeat protein/class 3 adenylate cyclase